MAYLVLVSVTLFGSVSALIGNIRYPNGEIDIMNLTNHVLALEQTFKNASNQYDAKIADLENTIGTLQSSLQATNDELSYARADLNSKNDQLTNLTKALARLETPVSFEVVLTAGFFDVLDHEVLKFDSVIMNEGNGYGNTSGIFTAPLPGTYMFWVHVNNADGVKNLDIHIKKNNAYVVRANAPPNHMWGIASTRAIFRLQAKDQVWFTKFSGSSSIYGHGLSSYGGVLLMAD